MSKVTLHLRVRAECGCIYITTHPDRLARSTQLLALHAHTVMHTATPQMQVLSLGGAVMYTSGCLNPSLSWNSWVMPAHPLPPPFQPSDHEAHSGSTAFKNLGSCCLWVCSEHSLEATQGIHPRSDPDLPTCQRWACILKRGCVSVSGQSRGPHQTQKWDCSSLASSQQDA